MGNTEQSSVYVCTSTAMVILMAAQKAGEASEFVEYDSAMP